MKIPYTKPSITNLEVEYACDAAATGWGDKCYEYIHKFEKGYLEVPDLPGLGIDIDEESLRNYTVI